MKPCYIIAEAGVNHNGSEQTAFQLVDAAVTSGADAIKFQTFKAEELVSHRAHKAGYQKKQTGDDGSQFSMLKALELSEESHRHLVAYCAEKNIEFLSTPFDYDSADFLISLGCRRIKVASGELTNTLFLRFLATKGLPIILSTGMGTLDEVVKAVNTIAQERESQGFSEPLPEMLTLLHCTSSYPTKLEDVNLRAMQTLSDTLQLPVGYSDHTADIFVAPIARVLGAVVIEKHLTLNRDLPGPDHSASLEPEEFSKMVRAIRNTDILLGSPLKVPANSELEVRTAARRSVTLLVDVPAGKIVTQDMLTLMRPGDGVPPADLDRVVGRTLKHSLLAGDTLHWEDIVE